MTEAPSLTQPARRTRATAQRRTVDIKPVRQLIWAYFFFWIFEGAFRKWVLPSASDALLLVRDPIVLAIYWLSWQRGLMPRNGFMLYGAVLAGAMLVAGLLGPDGTPLVALYGFRCSFLHLPLIFIIAKVLDARDVNRAGYLLLLLSIPMALLMVIQFRSPGSAWINSGLDGNFRQLDLGADHIRAPGTFSFISGPIYFYSLVAAFLLHSQFTVRQYPLWLTLSAGLSLASATAVSGSRSMALSIILVFVIGMGAGSILQPRLVFRWLWAILVLATVIYFVSDLEYFQEGLSVFSRRVTVASTSEGGTEGLLSRFFGDYLHAWELMFESPLLGHGLGVGTNVGSALLRGKLQFLLAEGEWERIILESGPILGGGFIVFRLALTASIGATALRHMALRDPLPLLLFSAVLLSLVAGNTGQPTLLGFIISASGLALSATRVPQTAPVRSPASRRPDFVPVVNAAPQP